MTEVLIGFDSAWTDNARAPGAVAGYRFGPGGERAFFEPRLATFAEAEQFIAGLSAGADYVLIALDQPTLVPNREGSRPVDKVAGSLISRLGGGVQPARRAATAMFGDAAPVWRFLERIDARQNPIEARTAGSGRYLMEVFPALALPALVPAIGRRGRAAKYNPANRSFVAEDWPLVAFGLAGFAAGHGMDELAGWARTEAARAAPTKAHQDRLDAAICLAVALLWRHGQERACLQIGDERHGYIVTPVSPVTRTILTRAAEERGVPLDRRWTGTADTAWRIPGEKLSAPPPSTSPCLAGRRAGAHLKSSAPMQKRPRRDETVQSAGRTVPAGSPPASPPSPLSSPGLTRRSTATALPPAARPLDARVKPGHDTLKNPAPARCDPEALRTLLIERARAGAPITYGEVAAAFGHRWTQGFGASLTAALNAVDRGNRRAGEPRLMCLVVNKETRLPGEGFYRAIGRERACSSQRHFPRGPLRRLWQRLDPMLNYQKSGQSWVRLWERR